MANAKDIQPGTPPSLLIVGDGGVGKTRFLRTIPGLYVFDFDGGMTSLRGLDIEYDVFKDAPRGVPVTKETTAKTGLRDFGTSWDAFFLKLQAIGKLIDKGEGPKAIAFDSLTFMAIVAVNKILKDTNQPMPHQGTWGAHHEYFKAIFSQVTAWQIPVIATAHIERKENDLTQVVEKLPMLAGKMAGMIGLFFDEVYYLESKVVDKAGKKERQVTIISGQTPQLKQAKSRWNVPDGTEADYGAIMKSITAAQK